MNIKKDMKYCTEKSGQANVEYSALMLAFLAGGWWTFNSELFSGLIDAITDQLYTTLIIINMPL